MKVIGLTGSIGMGKSFVSSIFEEMGAVIYDADAEIHKLIESGGDGVELVLEAFPEVANDEGGIDRKKLGMEVFSNNEKLKKLESILHPLVKQRGEEMMRKAKEDGCEIFIQDVPLLFEKGVDKSCDHTLVVYTSKEIQKQRVLERDGMTEEILEAIDSLQMPVSEKLKRATFNIDNSGSRENTREQVKELVKKLKENSIGR